MAITVKDIVSLLEEFAPPKLAEDWDTIGLQTGSLQAKTKKIFVALDPSLQTVQYATENGFDFLITHHPLFFKPLKRIESESPLGKTLKYALQHDLAIYCAHTNWDATFEGINDILVERFGLEKPHSLTPTRNDTPGLGRVGILKKEMTLTDLIGLVKEELQVDHTRFVGDLKRMMKRIAICSGSGSKLLDLARSHGVDCFITGDIGYHIALEAAEGGPALIDPGHFAMENIAVPVLAQWLKDQAKTKNWNIQVEYDEKGRDPFQFH